MLILGDRQITKKGTESEIRKIYNLASKFNQELTQENYDLLLDELAPTRSLIESGKLEVDELGRVFLAGSTIPVPASLGETLQRYIGAKIDISPLINFWRLCLLNPNPVARDSFFDYVQKYNVTITPSGEVVMYKAVTHKEAAPDFDTDLQAFVARAITAVQRIQHSLESYDVYRNLDGTFITPSGQLVEEGNLFLQISETRVSHTYFREPKSEIEFLGTLDQLAEKIASLPTLALYTDKYTRKMNIRIGEVVWKNREECDNNPGVGCSHGLHVGAFPYVKGFTGHNDTVLACLLNPMNVVAVPDYDQSKMRVSEYFPYSIMEKEEDGSWQEIDSPYFEAAYAPLLAGSILNRMEEIELETVSVKQVAFRNELLKISRQVIVDLGIKVEEAITERPEENRAPDDSLSDCDDEEPDCDDEEEEPFDDDDPEHDNGSLG